MQIKITSYKSFNAQSFNDISSFLYAEMDGVGRIIRSLREPIYAEWLECIEEYIALGKQLFFLGNRKRAFRIYIMIIYLIHNSPSLDKSNKPKSESVPDSSAMSKNDKAPNQAPISNKARVNEYDNSRQKTSLYNGPSSFTRKDYSSRKKER